MFQNNLDRPTEKLPQRWLTVTESAAYLRVSPQLIRNCIHSGELKASRFGQGYLLELADLDKYILHRKKSIPPYRRGTKPWVARRHADNRKGASR